MALRFPITLLKKEQLTSNVVNFIFVKPKAFTFSPGQYVRIFDPILGENVFRDFTISSSPLEKETFTLTIKNGISEYKKNLFSAKTGSQFFVEAPMGRFYIDENETIPQVFLAGGVGIAPFYSMVTYLSQANKIIPVTLIASFSSYEDGIFFDELHSFANNKTDLHVVYTYTKTPPKAWSGETGRISEKMIGTFVQDVSLPVFRIAGSPSFVSDMEDLLLQTGVTLSQIKTEVFLGF